MQHYKIHQMKTMFYLTTHSTHFIYGYMASDIWLRTILIARKETRCRHMGYSFRLAARVLLYAPSHRQDSTYHGFVTPVVEHWLEREIAQWVHPMKDRSDDPSHYERTLLPQSYISLTMMDVINSQETTTKRMTNLGTEKFLTLLGPLLVVLLLHLRGRILQTKRINIF